ncbi:MAG: SulP family inorganic anion transporter [Longimicrobiales bacterium]
MHDVLAGIVVGIVALPLAIAFGIASGVRPEQGLYTAIVAGLVISVFSGSRVQIGGPTGAFVVLVFSIVQEFGYDGLAVATLLAGALLIAMGWARLGAVIRFIPYPVTVGFTTGIALVIAVGQIPDALGLQLAEAEVDFLPRMIAYFEARSSLDPVALALTAATIGVLVAWPRVSRRLPGPLVALVLATVATHAFGLDLETIQSRFGGVPSTLPEFRLPVVDLATVPLLLQPALAIALLAGIESLLSAVVADGMTGRRHRANAELVAQGLANLASPLFGGIPATGAIARTATNVKNGGRTPVAGIVHALTLLVILTTIGRWVALVPMAALAGILLVVAYNMSELRMFRGLLRGPRSDVLVLVSTFALTVLVDLVMALEVGVVMAALLFMRRMSEVSTVRSITDQFTDEERAGFAFEDADVVLPEGTEVFEVAGSFFFGSAQRFSEVLSEMRSKPRLVILRLRDVLALDSTGLYALEQVHTRLRHRGTHLILSGVHAQPMDVLVRSGAYERIGVDNVKSTFREAAVRAWELLDETPPPLDEATADHNP